VAASDFNWLVGEFVVSVTSWTFLEVQSVAEDGRKTRSWANLVFVFDLFVINAFVFDAAVFAVPDVTDGVNFIADGTLLANSFFTAFWSEWTSKSWSGTISAKRVIDSWAETSVAFPIFVWATWVREFSDQPHADFWSGLADSNSWTAGEISWAIFGNWNPTRAAAFSW
jgi:hypothetical protein